MNPSGVLPTEKCELESGCESDELITSSRSSKASGVLDVCARTDVDYVSLSVLSPEASRFHDSGGRPVLSLNRREK
jgi:hypothetical protein